MQKRIRRITPVIQDDIINLYINHNHKIIDISKKYNLSHTAIYKVVNEYIGGLSIQQNHSTIAKESNDVAEINIAKESNDVAEINIAKESNDVAEINIAKESNDVAEINSAKIMAKESNDAAEINIAKESNDVAEINSAKESAGGVEIDNEIIINNFYDEETFYQDIIYK